MSQKNYRSKPYRRPLPKELHEPIYEPVNLLGALAGLGPVNALLETSLRSVADQKREERIKGRRWERFQLLFAHYRINPHGEDAWFELAVALAFDFVPGVTSTDSPPAKPGRPLRSTKDDHWSLADDIEELALRRSITASQACTYIGNRKRGRWTGVTGRALYARYLRHLTHRRMEPDGRLEGLRRSLAAAPEAAVQTRDAASPLWNLPLEEPIRRILESPEGGTKTH